MCLPPESNPSLHCIGKATGVNAAKWAVDQRPFIWNAASTPTEKPPAGALWTVWTDTFCPGAALPYAGVQPNTGGSDEKLEADSSLTLGSCLRASATTPGPKEIEILQTKVWEARPNSGEAVPRTAMQSFLCSPPFRAASGVDTLQQSLSKKCSVVSCTPSPTISMPIVQEDSQSTKVPHPIVPCETSRLKEEKSRRSSCIKELIEEARTQNASILKRKFNSGSALTRQKSTSTLQKGRRCNNRPAASKTEISTPYRDVSLSESLADDEDPSDDDDDLGGPGVSEKRRKRMLSNRASAQRSRQRRQERLDTLEVLVAELRVENAALTRKANNATMAAKKSEEENKILRDRLSKPETFPLSDSNASNDCDKTTENSNTTINNKNGSSWRLGIGLAGNDASNHVEETCPDKNLSRASSGALKEERGDEPVENSRRWKNSFSSSSFDFDFNSDLMENKTYDETFSRTTVPEKSGGVNMKDLYQSAAIINATQDHSFEGRDPFGMDLEPCNLEMDKPGLDSRSVDDIWLESLANCLK